MQSNTYFKMGCKLFNVGIIKVLYSSWFVGIIGKSYEGALSNRKQHWFLGISFLDSVKLLVIFKR